MNNLVNIGGLLPHGFCIQWTAELLWTYVTSDTLIAIAYFSISATLTYFVSRRSDLKFRSIYMLFSAFILASGLAHLMDIALFWLPFYWVDALLKSVTAFISITTAAILVRLVPVALKLPSNQQFEAEIQARIKIQTELQESESRQRALSQQLGNLIQAIPDAIIFKDGDGQLLIANEYALKLFRLDALNWKGKTYLELASEDSDLLASGIKVFLDDEPVWQSGQMFMFEERIPDHAGNLIDIEVRKRPVFMENGERKGMVVICRNISEIRWAEKQLRIAEMAIESQDGILITDENNIIVRVNNAFSQLTGYQADEVIGKRPSILKSGRHSKEFYREMWSTLQREKRWQGEVWDRRKNGDIYPKWLTINSVTGRDGRVCNYVAAFTDLSQHKEAQELIHRLAYFDPLTNLPNRRLLQDRLLQSLNNSAHEDQYGALLMIDVDNFKNINDTLGHHIGDQLLLEIANRLKNCLRQCDTVARLGGDEFIILLDKLGDSERQAVANAEEISQKVLNSINSTLIIGEQEYISSISIGISLFYNNNQSPDDILKKADAALYLAKDAGRNTSRFFDPQMQEIMECRERLKLDLRHALTQGQLSLYYQPQVNNSGKIIGAETLLRWCHPIRGMVSPSEFIPLAEESGLILAIGSWVIQTVCEQLKAWETNPLTKDLHLAVNVSARQFRQADFVEQIREKLKTTGARPAKLKLELTETLVLHNVADTIEKMQTLKSAGVCFSMDDFGTGYSSLSYLKKLPLNQLKIDQSFVRDIIIDPNDAVIAQTIIGMGHTLGLNVIAEGVETEEQRNCLVNIGCDAFQGFLFSKPVPLEDFKQFLEQTNRHQPIEIPA